MKKTAKNNYLIVYKSSELHRWLGKERMRVREGERERERLRERGREEERRIERERGRETKRERESICTRERERGGGDVKERCVRTERQTEKWIYFLRTKSLIHSFVVETF